MRLDFLVTKGSSAPCNSTICPRNGPKRRQKAPKTAQCAPAPRNQERAVSWATWLKNEFRGHLVHPQPPTFYGFQASELPNETRRPRYWWSLGAAGGPASPRTVGANGGSTRVPKAKKITFSKVVPRPLGMLKQVFLGRFEPVVARFGPWKIPKCLENGPFGDQHWVKNGSKTHFSKSDPGPFAVLRQVVLAHFVPVVTCFGPWKIPKCLENGPFWDQKWVKNGSKTRFSKSDPGPFEMLKQVFLARFEPVLTQFSPFHHMYAPLCALRTYLRAVWWSHLELGEGCRLEDIYIYIYIYYYTPLPLNLANKQQATTTTTTTRHHSVLATAPSQRFGLDSTLAILEPRWWPCQIQVLSQKLTSGGPGRGRQVGRCRPKSAQVWAKNSHFRPKQP